MKTTRKPKTKTVTKKRESRGQLIPDLVKKTNAEIALTVAAHGTVYNLLSDAIKLMLEGKRLILTFDDGEERAYYGCNTAYTEFTKEACANWRNIIDVLFASISYANDRIEVDVNLTKKQTPTPKNAKAAA